MRRDHKYDRLSINGSGFPVPVLGSPQQLPGIDNYDRQSEL
jgi:hypothetical protein